MTHLLQRIVLGAAGIIALGIGSAIAITPAAFYGTYGIEIGSGPDLLSELRAPGVNLAVLGLLIAAGAVKTQLTRLASMLGAFVFLSYAAGRLIGVAADGWPSGGIIDAMMIELVIGGVCLALFLRGRTAASALPNLAGQAT